MKQGVVDFKERKNSTCNRHSNSTQHCTHKTQGGGMVKPPSKCANHWYSIEIPTLRHTTLHSQTMQHHTRAQCIHRCTSTTFTTNQQTQVKLKLQSTAFQQPHCPLRDSQTSRRENTQHVVVTLTKHSNCIYKTQRRCKWSPSKCANHWL